MSDRGTSEGVAGLYVKPKDMKSLGEALRVAEGMIMRNTQYRHLGSHLANLIWQVDRHRPVGPDGTHNNRHTPTCGCEVPDADD